jgi:pSer/pThr/pTyr-binding forkhead associated (FHA) protein
MSIKILISLVSILLLFFIILLLIFRSEEFFAWFSNQWVDVVYAAIMAIIAGIVLEYLYRRRYSRSKMLKTTITPHSLTNKSIAKLVLKEKQEFLIKEYERTFGREDFVGVVVADDLLFIGKEHFKITRKDDGFYIEDLNTKNGTLINGKEIKEGEKVRLENGDVINVANTLDIEYYEKMI